MTAANKTSKLNLNIPVAPRRHLTGSIGQKYIFKKILQTLKLKRDNMQHYFFYYCNQLLYKKPFFTGAVGTCLEWETGKVCVSNNITAGSVSHRSVTVIQHTLQLKQLNGTEPSKSSRTKANLSTFTKQSKRHPANIFIPTCSTKLCAKLCFKAEMGTYLARLAAQRHLTLL